MPGSGTSVPLVVLPEVVLPEVVLPELLVVLQVMWPQLQVWVWKPLVELPDDELFHQAAEAGTAAVMAARAVAAIKDLRNILGSPCTSNRKWLPACDARGVPDKGVWS